MRSLLLFIILITFFGSANAEYYISYSPAPCSGCDVSPPTHHRAKHRVKIKRHIKRHNPCHEVVYKHHVRHIARHKTESDYRYGWHFLAFDGNCKKGEACYRLQRSACGETQVCARYPGEHVVSGAQPEVYGEYCTTYQDVQRGDDP